MISGKENIHADDVKIYNLLVEWEQYKAENDRILAIFKRTRNHILGPVRIQ